MDEKKKKLDSKSKDTKEEIISKAGEVKDSVSEKGEEMKLKASEAKDSVADRSKEFKESASEKTEEFRSTAEKMVNDVLKTLREKQEDLGKTIEDYTAPATPYVDIIETPAEFIIIADLPAVEKEDLSVDVTNDSVTITAKFPEGRKGDNINYVKRERGFGEVSRNLQLTHEVKIKEANADFSGSILTITLPKKIAESQKLEIK
jgi:HSP20 family protein